jgi:hypothetical protein
MGVMNGTPFMTVLLKKNIELLIHEGHAFCPFWKKGTKTSLLIFATGKNHFIQN